jgi:polysaccharide pyruvyl transferase WcaK-like protein
LYRQAFDRRLNIVLQSELADMYFTLGRTNNKEINAISGRIISECYGSDATEVAKYLTEKGHVFFDYDTWLAANTQYSLAVGTRMHGAIAALISGVPSVLICHDDRTRELAEVMPLPHVMADALDMSAPLDFHKLSGLFDSEQVHDKYAVYRSNYLEFMRLNGLQLKD